MYIWRVLFCKIYQTSPQYKIKLQKPQGSWYHRVHHNLKQRQYHILHTSISESVRRKRQRCECRVIYEDDKHAVHLYNAVNDQLLHLEEVSLGLATALWDAADPNLFLLSDGQVLYTFLYSPVSLHGAGEHTHGCCSCYVSSK